MDANRTGGIVLCGGQSSRMGTPKAWLTIDGETMLARTVRVLREVVSPVIVSAAAGQDLPPLPQDVRIMHDEVPDCGPLPGLVSAMKAMECEIVFVASVDLPRLTSNVLWEIVKALQANPEAVAAVPRIEGQPQPLAAAYRTKVLPFIQKQLAANRLAMRELLSLIPVIWLDHFDPLVFLNINTPEEYRQIVRNNAEA